MMSHIKVVIADDIKETRESIERFLGLDRQIRVVGKAANGQEVLELVKDTKPDLVLMDVNMPVMDGIKATELLSLHFPETAVVIVSVQGEQEYLKKAMMAGAREYLIKPFTADELISTVKRVVEAHRRRQELQAGRNRGLPKHQPQMIAVFGAKGGVGKTTVAVNLAVALARTTGERVALIDLDLEFGDVGVMLNLAPRATIAELMQESLEFDQELLENYLVEKHGVKVLLAPSRPELAELVNEEGAAKVIKTLLASSDYVVVDTPDRFSDVTLAALELSDTVFMVVSPDLPCLKNTKRALEVMRNLGFKDKVKLILNRASSGFGIEEEDVEKAMEMQVALSLPADVRLVVSSMNRGEPLVLAEPTSLLAKGIHKMALLVRGQADSGRVEERNRFIFRTWKLAEKGI